jgi:phosphopentomutase
MRLGWGRRSGWPRARRCRGFAAVPAGLWGAATEVSRARTRRRGIGNWPGCRCPGTGPIFPTRCPPSRPTWWPRSAAGGDRGILGNCHASGVPIIAEHCEEHLRTGWPICYTSADSVFQIAAHEEAFGLERLLKLCAGPGAACCTREGGPGDRAALHRGIAGPSSAPRTGMTLPSRRRRRRFWTGWRGRAGRPMRIGKIGDIFSMRGIGKLWKGKSDADLFEHLVRLGGEAEAGSLTFANFVEFDTLYGHPRDVAGYARALEWFDAQVPRFLAPFGPAIWRSLPPTTATTRPGAAPSTPANGCRWWAGAMAPAASGLRGFVDVGPASRRIWGWARRGRGGVSCDRPGGASPRTPGIFEDR